MHCRDDMYLWCVSWIHNAVRKKSGGACLGSQSIINVLLIYNHRSVSSSLRNTVSAASTCMSSLSFSQSLSKKSCWDSSFSIYFLIRSAFPSSFIPATCRSFLSSSSPVDLLRQVLKNCSSMSLLATRSTSLWVLTKDKWYPKFGASVSSCIFFRTSRNTIIWGEYTFRRVSPVASLILKVKRDMNYADNDGRRYWRQLSEQWCECKFGTTVSHFGHETYGFPLNLAIWSLSALRAALSWSNHLIWAPYVSSI